MIAKDLRAYSALNLRQEVCFRDQVAWRIVMSPPPEVAVITFCDNVLMGTDSLTVPPSVVAVT